MFRDLELRDRVPKWRNGRREGLKNLWALARVGSTPTFGTNVREDLSRLELWTMAPTVKELREWCRGADSNRRHMDFQSIALPAELPRQRV